MNTSFQIVVIMAIALPLFMITIFPPVSTSAQNMTDNLTSSNATQGTVENMTDVGGISSFEGGGGGGGSSNDGGNGNEGDGSGDAGFGGGGGGSGSGSGSGGSIIITN
jgi:hypothetical protein